MRNKRAVMTVAALLILAYHIWIPVLRGNAIERFMLYSAYYGVDMFFLISAFSVSSRGITDVKKFLISRLKFVYLPFVFFSIMAVLYNSYGILRLLYTVSGVELLVRGGGAFLWFLPAIMLMYLLLVLTEHFAKKNAVISYVAVIAIWFIVGVAVTAFTPYRAMFIWWNRIPVVMLGSALGRVTNRWPFMLKRRYELLAGAVLFALGLFIIWMFGYREKLSVPIADMFYILGIPSAVGLTLLTDAIPENGFMNCIGAATLEIYAFQMIFGYDLANYVYSYTKMPLFTNIISFSVVLLLSVAVSTLWRSIVPRKRKPS